MLRCLSSPICLCLCGDEGVSQIYGATVDGRESQLTFQAPESGHLLLLFWCLLWGYSPKLTVLQLSTTVNPLVQTLDIPMSSVVAV